MAKFLEYVLSLKDKMSDSLKKVGATSTGANAEIAKLQKKVNDLDSAFSRASTGGVSKFNIAMGNLIAQGVTRLGQMTSDFISGSANAAIRREQDIVGLTTFLGANAEKVYAAIEGDAAATPFGLESLLSVNKSLISTGMNADKARQDTLNLSNAVAAVGGSDDVLARMGANMQQIANTGKASAMDIKQFAFAGINIYSLLSKATGKSVAEVQKMDVSYELLSTSLAKAAAAGGLYAGASERQSKTMGGLISTVKDGFNKFMADTGDRMKPFLQKLIGYFQKFVAYTPQILDAITPIIKAVGNLFSWLIGIIKSVVHFFQSWWQKIQEGSPVIIALTALVVGIAAAIGIYYGLILLVTAAMGAWNLIQAILNATMLASPITWIVGLVIGFIALIGYIIYRYKGWGEAWKNLVAYLNYSWQGFKESFHFMWLKVVDVFMTGIEAMMRAWYKFKSLWDEDGANAGLSKLDDQATERARNLAASKGKLAEFDKMAAESFNKIGLTDTGKGIKEMVKDTKDKLGIAPASQPGVTTKFPGTGGGGGGKAGAKSNEAVATGGTKNTTIHIQIGKQVETINLLTNNLKEGAEKIRDIIVDEMTRAIAMSQAIAE